MERGNLLAQSGLVEKKPVESEQKKLSKSEAKMLMEGCSLMQNDAVETLSICTALNALVISVISVIVSVAMVASMVNSDTQPVLVLTVCAVAVVIIVTEIILYCTAKKRSSANAKKADRYRDAYLMLLTLSEEEAERVNESQKLEDLKDAEKRDQSCRLLLKGRRNGWKKKKLTKAERIYDNSVHHLLTIHKYPAIVPFLTADKPQNRCKALELRAAQYTR